MSSSPNRKIITVGRSSSCHIIIDNPNVSSSHARFIVEGTSVTLEDTNSTNGTFVNGERIKSKSVTKSDKISFSKKYLFSWNDLDPFIKIASGEIPARQEERLKTRIAKEKNIISIGRTSDNDLVINNIKVSRKHARIEKKGEDWFLEDLDSSNGTFINGKRIKTCFFIKTPNSGYLNFSLPFPSLFLCFFPYMILLILIFVFRCLKYEFHVQAMFCGRNKN